MPEVSIIVPVYNAEEYIEKAIKSILNQTVRNFELIIVDDGSTDKSLFIIEKYSNDVRVKIITKKNEGVSAARNEGMKIAKGKYIGFIDCDDEVAETLLAKTLMAAEETQADMVMFGYYKDQVNNKEEILTRTPVQMEAGNFTREKSLGWQVNADSQAMMGYIWNKLYKTEILLEKELFFKEDMYFLEDIDFNTAVFQEIKTVTVISDCLYYYKRRSRISLVSTFRKNDFDMQLYAIDCREQILRDWKNEEGRIQKITAFLHVHAVKGSCVNLFLNKNDLSFSEKCSYLNEIMERPLTQERIKLFSPQNTIEWLFKVTIEKKMSYSLAFMSSLYATKKRMMQSNT